ncbi:MAG: glycosyltransferase [Rhodococcus sp. (in: high G+C Gram-positive bacteria)]
MRILLDGYHWFEGPPSGVVIIHELVACWRGAYPDDQLALALARDPNQGESDALAAQGVDWVRTRLPLHPLRNGLELALHGRAFDWVLCQNFTPLLGRSAVFLHDSIFQTNPEWFTRSELAYLSLYPRLARRARVRWTSSDTEAQRIMACNPALTDVEPVGLGVSTELITCEPDADPSDGLSPFGFVLSVGRLNTRKNLARTILAALDAGAISPGRPLVIAGEADGLADAHDRRITSAIDDGSVRYTGHVSTRYLSWLYRNTALFVFLSLDEGFGLPPLEARTFGAPVLVSDLPVFHETLGDRARFVDPTDVAAITRALSSMPSRRAVTDIDASNMPTWDQVIGRMRRSLDAADDTRRRNRRRRATTMSVTSMMDRVYWKLRQRHLPETMTAAEILELVSYRGAQALRGQVLGLRYLDGLSLHFRGRAVRVIAPSKLTVGAGVVFGDSVLVDATSRGGIRLGAGVTVGRGASILGSGVIAEPGVGVEVGAGTAIGMYNVIWGQGGVSIGENCLLAPHVVMVSENHASDDVDAPMNRQGFVRAAIVLEDDVWLGAGVVVTSGVTIGKGAIVGAGAVVTKDVAPHEVVGGVPARLIKSRVSESAVGR